VLLLHAPLGLPPSPSAGSSPLLFSFVLCLFLFCRQQLHVLLCLSPIYCVWFPPHKTLSPPLDPFSPFSFLDVPSPSPSCPVIVCKICRRFRKPTSLKLIATLLDLFFSRFPFGCCSRTFPSRGSYSLIPSVPSAFRRFFWVIISGLSLLFPYLVIFSGVCV